MNRPSRHTAMPTGAAPALASQLLPVADALAAVRQGQSVRTVLARVDAAQRPGVQALLFEVLRHLGTAEALRGRLAARKPAAPADALLCSALAVLLPEPPRYDAFTLVNQTVEAAKRRPATRAQAAFINGCLRRFLRERDALMAAVEDDPVARWNHPRWWLQRLQRDYPDRWQDILQANNAQAPLALRVNGLQVSRDAYLAQLAEAGLDAVAGIGPASILLRQAVPVDQLPGFGEGRVSVQDCAAQMAAPLLLDGLAKPAGRPWHVLDACAAPGGKTAHLLEHAGGSEAAQVVAIEVDARRAERMQDTLSRVGVQAEMLVADASDVPAWWPALQARQGIAGFDAVLLDAPCSASGIVRRQPDVRWLRRATDIDQLATIQQRLLQQLWPLVLPGGRLLYCTCSVFRQEGEDQIERFLAAHADARRLPAPGHLLPQRLLDGGEAADLARDHDGFYYALLERVAP
ncbi:16S rRNA (cytosine(967)-C(5))-methyltransferase RsmB [Comamonas humi]